jgi:hypothetical protein
MVHGMIQVHCIGSEVINFRGLSDDFTTPSGVSIKTDNWNLLLIAVAYKHTEIVRYLIEDASISLRLFGGR